MKLAIFDIDGTLTDSSAIDSECFLSAFQSEFGLSATDWSEYPNHTDRGLTEEFLRRASLLSEEAITRHRTTFLKLLRERIEDLDEIRGARAFIAFLQNRGWTVTLATGAWSESARLKLAAAGLPVELPLACCNDLVSREEIVRHAIALGGHHPYERIVLFGDGVWDVRTARYLSLPFIGVGAGAAADALLRAGAREVIPDFTDVDGVLLSMLRAEAPR